MSPKTEPKVKKVAAKKAPAKKTEAATAPAKTTKPTKTDTDLKAAIKPVAKAGNASTSSARPAKAGRRSEKALKETAEMVKKDEKKLQEPTVSDVKPKHTQKPPKSRLERKSKKYREVYKNVDATKTYNLDDALEAITKTNPAKFDAAVELHVRLNVDPKQADQNIRDVVVLPNGTGNKVRVAVFADDADAAKALKAGADLAGNDDFLAKLEKGEFNFDVLISTPAAMPRLSKYARVLGPKGLMPNPKNGTVTADVAKATSEAKAGRVEYRVDPSGIIHLSVGKVSFGGKKLSQNAEVAINSIKSNKPSGIKGVFVESIYLASTMGPSVKVKI